jgi:hypothetical protein
MARRTPTVWVMAWGPAAQGELQLPGAEGQDIRVESPAWWAWLEAPTTSSFAYPLYDGEVGYIRGFLTVRKEVRARGGQYWVAYRRTGGRLRKIYLGRSVELTQQQLAATAERFLALDGPARPRAARREEQQEVQPGQYGGASSRWEVTTRRSECSQRVVRFGRPYGQLVPFGRPWVALYGRRWWYIHGRLLTPSSSLPPAVPASATRISCS